MASNADQLYKKVTLLMGKESWPEAVKLLKHESPLVEQDWRLSWNLGWCYFKLNRLDNTKRHLLRAVKIAPGNPTCKWALGNVYLKKKQFRKAETVLADSLKIKESHLTRIALALAYLSQGKIEEAEKVHLDGIKLGSKLSERYESYAAFLSDIGREAEAQKMNQKVKDLRVIN